MDNFETYLKSNAGISDDEYNLLTQNLRVQNLPKGNMVLEKGAVCKHSFFVEKGLLKSFTIDRSGKEHIIQFASENWIISDRSSTLFNEPSELFIETIEDSVIIFLGADFISKASDLSPNFRNFNQLALHNHIRQQQKRINFLLAASAEERYLNFIKLYPDLMLRVPQWMIASYLGITPESLSRVRKELAKRNFRPN